MRENLFHANKCGSTRGATIPCKFRNTSKSTDFYLEDFYLIFPTCLILEIFNEIEDEMFDLRV